MVDVGQYQQLEIQRATKYFMPILTKYRFFCINKIKSLEKENDEVDK